MGRIMSRVWKRYQNILLKDTKGKGWKWKRY